MGKKNKAKSNKQEKVVLTAFQIKERRTRTCFVGNVPLEMTAKQLKTVFSQCGQVETVWFRSVPTQFDSKHPQRAKVILKEYSGQKDNKNAYVLFEKSEEAILAVKTLNQFLVQDKHIRVDLDSKTIEGADVAECGARSQIENDTNTTVFIGNLPFSVNEEELRKHMVSGLKTGNKGQAGQVLDGAGDGILNVRVIRDKETHIGKGIAYIMFASKPLMRLAIDQMNGTKFMGRELRIKKAVSAVRLEKKKNRTLERANVKMEEAAARAKAMEAAREANEAEQNDIDQLRNIGDFYKQMDSEDSDDDERRKKKKVGLNAKSKKIQKDDSDEFRAHIKKIAQRSANATTLEKNGLDTTSKLAFNKKKTQKVMKEMIASGGARSRYEEQKSHETTKHEPTFKQSLRAKIEKKKHSNLKKINMIKVKRVVEK